MASIGPTLPPHLQPKRKRVDADEDHAARSRSRSSSVDSSKKRRLHGPSMPPADLNQRPTTSPSASPRVSAAPDLSSDSDSDSDFGPAPAGTGNSSIALVARQSDGDDTTKTTNTEPQKPQREEWMLNPPTHGDWTSRVDPTKLRNRKFNTGKGAKAPAQGGSTDNRLWTETPEQKRQRLDDEVMGVKKAAQAEEAPRKSARDEAKDRETEKKIREYNESHRGKSLYAEHKTTTPEDKEDDPSKRAFDREKDIGGVNIGFAKRKEMMNKAADFGSRFAKGSYL